MRTKKLIEKMMIGMLLGSGCLLSSCHSVYMSAEDRLQGDYQEAVAEVELETVEELRKMDADTYQLIDIRSESEIAHGAIPGATAIPGEKIADSELTDKGKNYDFSD